MKHVSPAANQKFLSFCRRGALLLTLGAAGPAAWGQSFGRKIDYPTGVYPSSLALGDVNSDGFLDIVTANLDTGTVSVLLGRATGGFNPAVDYLTGPRPISVALGDMNSDGHLDIIVANNAANGTVSVIPGLLSGGFGPRVSYSTATYPVDVTLGDVNGDGRLDLVLVNALTSASVLLGQASGFGSSTNYPAGTDSNSGTLGDVNGDGRLDLVTANWGGFVSVLPGQPSGGFGNPSTYPTPLYTYEAALGDVNGDGSLDIVTANSSGTSSVLLNQVGQAMGFGPKTDYSTGGYSEGVALGDLTGDGHLDMVIANHGPVSSGNVGTVSVLVGQVGGFGPKTDFVTGAGTTAVALGDVNSDGRLDIVATNYNSNTVSVLLNAGTFTPLATTRPAAADVALYPNPAHNAFTVQLPAALGSASIQAELLNALGQVVRRPAAASPRFSVDVNGLAPGIYTLRLATGAGSLAKRVVVE